MFRNPFIYLICLLLVCNCARKSEFSDWRGPNRDGIYPETGPDEGPALLWSYEGLGFGHNAMAIANNKIFVTGIKDSIESTGKLFAFDLDGNLLWENIFGKEFNSNFLGTRSTPVVVNDLIYMESGMGVVYCLNAENGEEIWSRDFIKDFGVDSVIQFGFAAEVDLRP